MKLRIEPGAISFRVDFDELEQLLMEGRLREFTDLPNGALTYTVICLPSGSAAHFAADGADFTLSLAKDIIEAHKAALPSLQGIILEFPTANSTNITVSLEVNLKKKLKHSLER